MCANCPFRATGAIELRPGRLQGIVADLRNDSIIFPCHKTSHKKTVHACMGALAYQWKYSKLPIFARIGIIHKALSIEDIKSAAEQLRGELCDDQ